MYSLDNLAQGQIDRSPRNTGKGHINLLAKLHLLRLKGLQWASFNLTNETNIKYRKLGDFMSLGVDLITGIASSLIYDGIKRPFRALTDAQNRRRAFSAHKELSALKDKDPITDNAISDLIKYIGNNEGSYTNQTAIFLHELSKTSIPDSIKMLSASGRDTQSIYPDFSRVYDLFESLPFEKEHFFKLFCTAIKTRFEESIDSKIILDAVNATGAEITARLDSIERQATSRDPENYAYVEFAEDRLRVAKSIELAHKNITVETNAGAKKLALSKMVVPARLTEVSDASEIPSPHRESFRNQPSGISVINFRRSFYNAVILGDPGGGKTTLTQHICHSLSQQIILEAGNPLDKHFDTRDLKLPIRITLRRFEARVKAESRYNLLDYIKDDLRAQFSNSDERAMRFVNQILRTGQSVIIFDGLDEILDVSSRRDVVEAIEGFINQFPACPSLVTSRIVGYADAPMFAEFKLFTLSRFNESEIKKYATNFLKAISGKKKDEVKSKVDTFLIQSASNASDLRENPLLLGLMIYIFNARGDVPNNRPEIYKECSLLMFEKWDQRRDINFNVPSDFYLVDLFSFLASKIFGDSDAEEGVDAVWLERTLRQYFDVWYEDRGKSVTAARTLVDFITGRAWVMCEIGPGVFKFTHRTFLEYFFARRVEEESGSVKDLISNLILPKAAHAEWDVVTHLALQISTFRSGPKSKQALESLLEQLSLAPLSSSEKINYLHFVIRAIGYLVVSEIETSRACRVVCEEILSLQDRSPSEIADLFYSLLSIKGASPETIPTLISENICEAIKSGSATQYMNAVFVLGARLSGFRGYSQAHSGSFDFSLVWKETSKARISLKSLLHTKAIQNVDDARAFFFIYRDGAEELLKTHGLDFLVPTIQRKAHLEEHFCAFFSVVDSLGHLLKGNGSIALINFDIPRHDADLIYSHLFDLIVKDYESVMEKFSTHSGNFEFDVVDYCFEAFLHVQRQTKGLVRRLPDIAAHFAIMIIIRNGMQKGISKNDSDNYSPMRARLMRVFDGFDDTLKFFAEKSNNDTVSNIILVEGKKLSEILVPDV
ncbi:NACHT domain-containing protein [Paracoccus marcusii]|uniref:NACHT domain-containing protein n=1 Tax=Paracoccus marcusii TaxID=59779 RepID=UPI003735BBE5